MIINNNDIENILENTLHMLSFEKLNYINDYYY